MRSMAVLTACLACACQGGSRAEVDASPRPDAFVVRVDAGPKTYESAADFPRQGCDDTGSLEGFAYLGKWHNVPGDGGEAFDSYFLIDDDRGLRGILDLIPADRLLVDANNLFLHRRYNLSSLGVNLCAVVDQDTLGGHMARCNGLDCELVTVEATLVEPSTD